MARAAKGAPPPLPGILLSEDDFRQASHRAGVYESEVQTDPRVFERISMGLYREPASALRELISNAYDADATHVAIKTDAPRFRNIKVIDNGTGMSPDAIKRLIRNVGGSLKQQEAGRGARVTGAHPGYSKGGRRLIGKLGIGLYSVARLTSKFTVTTKERGADLRWIIEFSLQPVTDVAEDDHEPEGADDTYIAGHVRVRTEPVTTRERGDSGTTVLLEDIHPDARRVLQSIDRWDSYDALDDDRAKAKWFHWHIPRMSPDGAQVIAKPHLPWHDGDDPLQKFRRLVNGLSMPEQQQASNPSIDYTLDYYLGMLWKISLSAPLAYVEKDPFSLTATDSGGIDFYSLEGDATPEKLDMRGGVTIGEKGKVPYEGQSEMPFQVVIDEVELRRPVLFRKIIPDAKKLLKKPKMFVGGFDGKDDEGRPLRFSAYFFWSYDLVPKENNGILVRINGSSGTLFDKEFLDFRTSEMYRLQQVSAEVFVGEGLEDALNIDRESFDDASQHYRMLQRWVSRRMTRIMTRLKTDQKKAREERNEEEDEEAAAALMQRATEIWKSRSGKPRSKPPKIAVTSKQSADPKADISIVGVQSPKRFAVDRDPVFNARLRAIATVLDAYGLIAEMAEEDLSQLMSDVAELLQSFT